MADRDNTYTYDDPEFGDEDAEESTLPVRSDVAAQKPKYRPDFTQRPMSPAELSKSYDSVLQAVDAYKQQSPTWGPEQEKAYREQREEAKKLYEDQANRNQWISLAQVIGNNLIRMWATNRGAKQGVAVNPELTSPLDASRANDSAWRQYQDRLGNIKSERGEELEQRSLGDRIAREGAGEDLKQARGLFGEQYNTYQQELRDAAADARQRKREGDADRNRDRRESETLLKAQIADAKVQYANAQKEEQAATQAATILAVQDDLSPKTVDKLMLKYPQVMGAAGITPETLSGIDEASTEEGILWDSTNPETRKKLIQQQIIQAKKDKVANLRQALDQLLAGQGRENQPTTPPAGKDTVTVINPEGKRGTIPRSQLQDAIAQGYREVK
jgi:hypothetical protein